MIYSLLIFINRVQHMCFPKSIDFLPCAVILQCHVTPFTAKNERRGQALSYIYFLHIKPTWGPHQQCIILVWVRFAKIVCLSVLQHKQMGYVPADIRLGQRARFSGIFSNVRHMRQEAYSDECEGLAPSAVKFWSVLQNSVLCPWSWCTPKSF